MIGEFTFNDIPSSTFKLVCKSVKRPLLPTAKTRRVELIGASGYHDFDGLEYSGRQITMKIQYIGTSFNELRTRARNIAAWIATNSWVKLIINDEPDKYYLAKVTDEIDLDSLYESGSADIVFDCQPFAYSINEYTQNVTGTGVINHPGTRQIDHRSPQGSKFKIGVTGACTLTMNGKSLVYSGTDAAIIDNVEMELTVGGVNAFDKLSGDIDSFLTLLPGNNNLTVSSGTATVTYIPMWI